MKTKETSNTIEDSLERMYQLGYEHGKRVAAQDVYTTVLKRLEKINAKNG